MKAGVLGRLGDLVSGRGSKKVEKKRLKLPTLKETFVFAILGALGATINVVVNSAAIAEFMIFPSIRTIILGLLVGIVYSFLYSERDFPNSVMSIIAGYMGANFIDALIRTLQHMF